jgi:hypothetical protein
MKRVFRLFLLLYPAEYRRIFGEEMTNTFEELGHEHGWSVRFVIAELGGLIRGAASAWLERRRPAVATDGPARPWMPREVVEAQQRVDEHVAAMVHAIANHQFERARELSNQEREARANLDRLRERYGDELGMSF